ncbi:MAG: ribonuclease P protein component 1 [Methanobacteriota archaeon]|nr:MAG: ribonuclease P protein component 1 [Euryarchaeota archaeon]
MNLRKHELIGRSVAVVQSTDPSLVGIRGFVIDETRNTLLVEAAGREKRVPKHGARFWFDVQGGVEVDGDEILFRPEDRVKKAR